MGAAGGGSKRSDVHGVSMGSRGGSGTRRESDVKGRTGTAARENADNPGTPAAAAPAEINLASKLQRAPAVGVSAGRAGGGAGWIDRVGVAGFGVGRAAQRMG